MNCSRNVHFLMSKKLLVVFEDVCFFVIIFKVRELEMGELSEIASIINYEKGQRREGAT